MSGTHKARRRGQRRGLRNEDLLCYRINHEVAFRDHLGKRLGIDVIRADKSERSRLVSNEKATAPTKADIELSGSRCVGVSVKVAPEFEVDQRTVYSFSTNLEIMTGYGMSDEVREALQLLVGDFGKERWPGHLPILGGNNNRPRLGAGDLCLYKPELRVALENWLTYGLPEITRFVFSQGATVAGQAEYLWLYSKDEHDHIVSIEDIVFGVKRWLSSGNLVRISAIRNTIALPFGTLASASASPNVVIRAEFRLLRTLGVTLL